MKTTDLDMAAYLSLCGVEPTAVNCVDSGAHQFVYLEDELLDIYIEAYRGGDVDVPLRQFVDARRRMKSMRKAGARERRAYNIAASMRRRRERRPKV